jgi:hypothetical protein
LVRFAAFDYEVDESQVTIVSETGDRGQGIYQVTIPGIPTPVRYDRVGSVFMRHASAPPLPHELPNQVTPVGKPSNHAVIRYAAADNQVPAQSVTMIKMSEEMGSGTYHLNVNGNRMVYKKMGSSYLKAGSVIPGTNIAV